MNGVPSGGGPVVVLAGGTGGAKLARGMLEVVGAESLVVIANTGDDLEAHGVHVSPDPDLVTYWLADSIDERGWGIAGDTWNAMESLERRGRATWFRLGDADLDMCRLRTDVLHAGGRLTEAQMKVAAAAGVNATVLPMSDHPVRTHVRVDGAWLPFQEFMILRRGARPEAVDLRGARDARATPEVLAALASARAIVIGPSNPVISIGPILAVPGMRAAIESSPAPVVAVSPFVSGRAVKGPTESFCRMAGLPLGTGCAPVAYRGLLDGVVADEEPDRRRGGGPALLIADTLLDSPPARGRVATTTLEFAESLRRRPRAAATPAR